MTKKLLKETAEELKQKFFSSPIFDKLKIKYPDRDYDYQIDLMFDWWMNEKKRLPLSISAFDNWLSRSKVDESIVIARRKEYVYTSVRPDEPINISGLEAYKKMKERFGKKLIKNI